VALTIINAEEVRQLLPMAECIDVMADAMAAVSSATIDIPPRQFYPLIDHSADFGLMPGSSRELGNYGVKVISLHGDNPAAGLPAIQGFVALFDFDTGVPVALVEGAEITAIRTAAASGLATRLLSREDARSCGIFGTGVQAATHIDAMCAVRSVEEILVWGRNAATAESFAAEQATRTGLPVRATQDPAEAGACDLVCTVTGSPDPVLQGAWVQAGAHINLVGSHTLTNREADTELVAKAAVYVDLVSSAHREAGDIMIPVQQGAVDEEHIRGEIGQLIAGDIQGRREASQVTLYKSLGNTAQDLYAARHVLDCALEQDLGTRVLL
jgi:ornithine cyclodeaminase